jgi:hypothetical protein
MSCPGQDTLLSDVDIRTAEKADVPFIFARTLRDQRNNPAFHGCPDGLYHQYFHRALEHTLTRAVTFIACPAVKKVTIHGQDMVQSVDSRRILGFMIADPTELGLIVHHTYVRQSYNSHGTKTEDYRGLGIGQKLMDSMQREYALKTDKVIYTLKTAMFRYEKPFRVKLEQDSRFTFNPFLFWTLLPNGWETGIRKPSQQYMHEITG